jgi:hypothetical protein
VGGRAQVPAYVASNGGGRLMLGFFDLVAAGLHQVTPFSKRVGGFRT